MLPMIEATPRSKPVLLMGEEGKKRHADLVAAVSKQLAAAGYDLAASEGKKLTVTVPGHGQVTFSLRAGVDAVWLNISQIGELQVEESRGLNLDFFHSTDELNQVAAHLVGYLPEAIQTAIGPWDAVVPEPFTSGSTNSYTEALPMRRYWHECKGLVLYLPMTGTTVVPYELTKGGAYCVVVDFETGPNTPGGYNLHVGEGELRTAVERPLRAKSR